MYFMRSSWRSGGSKKAYLCEASKRKSKAAICNIGGDLMLYDPDEDDFDDDLDLDDEDEDYDL